jgi:hypothetical protein
MGRLQSLFSIRKDGASVAAGDERQLIDTASAQLDSGDVAGAMATMQKLQGPSAQAAAPWQAKAGATLAAQTLDTQLVSAIITKVKSGLSSAAGSSMPGVVNQGPINMAPAQSAPSSPETTIYNQSPSAVPEMPEPQATEPQAGDAAPSDMPAPSADDSGVTISQ